MNCSKFGHILEFTDELYECVVFVDKTIFFASCSPFFALFNILNTNALSVCTSIYLTNFARKEKHIQAEQFLLTSEVNVIHTLFFLF